MKKDELLAQLREVNAKLAGFESRELNDNEKAEYASAKASFDSLNRELTMLERESANKPAPVLNKKAAFRELLKAAMGMKDGIVLGRENAGISKSILNDGDLNNLVTAGAIPTDIKELLPLLQNELVYDKLGIQIATGVKGDIVWPVLAAGVSVTVNGEAAAVGDSHVNFGKKQAAPVRLAVATDITNEALDNAAFDVQAVVVNNLTEALRQFLNDAVLRTTAVGDGIDGPLTKAKTTKSISATYEGLMNLKGLVAKQNVNMAGAAFVMNNEMAATLEATPKAAGQCGFILENGKIGAYPVFVTEAIADNKIGFGCFNYAALNNHGETRLIVDPYTKAAQGKVVITLNSDWSLSTLREEAFALATVA